MIGEQSRKGVSGARLWIKRRWRLTPLTHPTDSPQVLVNVRPWNGANSGVVNPLLGRSFYCRAEGLLASPESRVVLGIGLESRLNIKNDTGWIRPSLRTFSPFLRLISALMALNVFVILKWRNKRHKILRFEIIDPMPIARKRFFTRD